MQSRGEAILRAIIDGGSASDLPAPQSRVEALLLELLESGAGGSLAIHVCTVDEYDAETGVPTIQDPDEKTIYLVPGDNETGSDLYIEWIYVDSNWEQFGSATIDLSDYALKSDLTGVVYNNTYATTSTGGAVKYNTSKGISVDNAGILTIYPAESGTIKSGSDTYKPIVPATQHEAAFYGLAEAAGDLTQISSPNAVGTYTDNAKSAIRRMIGSAGQDTIATDYASLSFPVSKGEHCIHGGKLYEAAQDIASSESWTAAHWTESTVGEELSDLKSAMTQLDDEKLDAPSTPGTATQVLVSDGEGGQVWGDIDAGEVVIDSTLSVAGAAADAKAVGDDFGYLLESGSNMEDISVLSQEGYKIINSDGTIAAGTLSNQIVYAFTITGYDGLFFKFTGRVGGENKIAFYSAETLANCSSSTLVGTVSSYTSATDNTVNSIPSGAKTVVIGAKSMTTMRGITNYKVSKANANLAAAYSTTKIYYVDEYCVYEGAVYRRKTYTGVAETTWDSTKWTLTKACDEIKTLNEHCFADVQYFDPTLFQIGSVNSDGEVITSQKYKVVTTNILTITDVTTITVATGYEVSLYYYDDNGDYLGSNGGLTTYQYATILAGSHIRVVIRIANSTDTLIDEQIPGLVHAVSFASEKAKRDATIAKNSEGALNALTAKMYQKGGTPIIHSLAPCILVAGQSNIDGRVPNADLPDTITPPFANIKNSINSTSGSFASSMTLPSSFGIDFSLYAALNDLGSTWYVIKKSMGGTSISPLGDSSYHWTPFYEELDDISKSLLYTFNTQIAQCVANNSNTFDIRALVWQQGEGDRADTSKKAALDYYKNFRCLIAYIRGIAGNERLPVVCGTVSHNSGQYDPIVEEATLRVAQEDPYVTCIDMSGATLLDSYHFDADSAVYFGYKAFDALIDFGVVSGTKINPTPPWED